MTAGTFLPQLLLLADHLCLPAGERPPPLLAAVLQLIDAASAPSAPASASAAATSAATSAAASAPATSVSLAASQPGPAHRVRLRNESPYSE